MRWDEIQDSPCSIARTLSVIGDRWTILILRDCFLGTRRFDDFQKQLGVTRHLLSDRLNKLVKYKILVKVCYQQKPKRFEYKLTEKGMELFPIIISISKWGDHWMSGTEGSPIEYKHRSCGKKMTATLNCSACGESINPRDVQPMIGPGLKHRLNQDDKHYLTGTTAYNFLKKSTDKASQ